MFTWIAYLAFLICSYYTVCSYTHVLHCSYPLFCSCPWPVVRSLSNAFLYKFVFALFHCAVKCLSVSCWFRFFFTLCQLMHFSWSALITKWKWFSHSGLICLIYVFLHVVRIYLSLGRQSRFLWDGCVFTVGKSDYNLGLQLYACVCGRSSSQLKHESVRTFQNLPGMNIQLHAAGSVQGQQPIFSRKLVSKQLGPACEFW